MYSNSPARNSQKHQQGLADQGDEPENDDAPDQGGVLLLTFKNQRYTRSPLHLACLPACLP